MVPSGSCCWRCGAVLSTEARFCGACGAALAIAAEVPAPSPPEVGTVPASGNPAGARRGGVVAVVAVLALAVVGGAIALMALSGGGANQRDAGADRASADAAEVPADGEQGGTEDAHPGALEVSAGALEVVTGTVDSSGGRLVLGSGLELVFPPNAVAGPIDVSVRLLDSQLVVGGLAGIALECQSSVAEFAAPVEIRVPLPADLSSEQAESALAGTVDPVTGVVVINHPLRLVEGGGRRELVLAVDHFSVIVIVVGGALVIKAGAIVLETLGGLIWGPPGAVTPISLPVYHQGDGPECLATSTTMVTKAIRPSSGEIWRLMQGAGISTRGLSSLAARLGSSFSDEVQRRTGSAPAVYLWQPVVNLETSPLLGAMKRYIKRELAQGHPVVFSSTAMSIGDGDIKHALVLVGYDANGYYGINPQDNSDSNCGIRAYSEEQLGISWSVSQSYLTIAVPRGLDSARTELSINFPPKSVWFQGPAGANAPIYAFNWDGSRPGGVSWSQYNKLSSRAGVGTAVDVVPGDVTQLFIGRPASDDNEASDGIELINAGEAARAVSVKLEVFNLSEGGRPVKLDGVRDELVQQVAVPARGKRRVGFIVDLMQLRPPTVKATQQYQIKASVVDGRQLDSASFEVSIAPDRDQPLVGTWEGQALGDVAIVLDITSQNGNNFAGTWAIEGETMGIEGSWDSVAKYWQLQIWELNVRPPRKFGAPGSLLPYTGGRLQLTAPGCLLSKRGVEYEGGGDDPYRVAEEYLRKLKNAAD